jgi:hypothetical protein
MIDDWRKDLLTEKSLWQVFRKSRALDKSSFNQGVYVFSFIIGIIICAFWIIPGKINDAADAVVTTADMSFDLSVQILGFLIGGFAILTTLADQRLMINLARAPMGSSGLSVFKNVFFNFLSVFYIYVITLSLSFSIKVFDRINIINLYDILDRKMSDHILLLFNCLLFLIIYFMGVIAIVRIKSFIWNIYQSFLTCLIAGHVFDAAATIQPPPQP